MAKIIFSFLLLLGPAALRAGAAEEGIFQRGNQAYETGDFETARKDYQALWDQGWGGPALAYNLGNAHERLGRPGLARLWYERALRAKPADADALHNVDIIRSRVQEKEETGLGRLARVRPALLWLLLAANLLFFTLLGLGLFRDSESLWWGRWISGVLLAGVLGLAWLARGQSLETHGVVVAPRAEARAGPGDDYRPAFVAPEGTKVVVFGASRGWTEIGLPDQGLKGWAPSAAVEKI